MKKLPAAFYRTSTGTEPVREWLRTLAEDDRKQIGDDIRATEYGWPIGMPLCRPLASRKGLWEVRTDLSGGRIARTFFCIEEGHMVLLHGIIKKSQKTPDSALDLAERRRKEVNR